MGTIKEIYATDALIDKTIAQPRSFLRDRELLKLRARIVLLKRMLDAKIYEVVGSE